MNETPTIYDAYCANCKSLTKHNEASGKCLVAGCGVIDPAKLDQHQVHTESTLNHDTELEEILSYHHDRGDDMRVPCRATWGDNTFSDCDCGLKETVAELNAYLYKQMLELIGDNVPISVGGKRIKHGDPMMIDLSGGTDSPIFRESCKNIQENGRNLEKAQLRKSAAERWGQV